MPFVSNELIKTLRVFEVSDVPRKVEAVARDIAQYGLEKAIELSPFATGQLVASWRIHLDHPDQDYSPKFTYGSKEAAGQAALVASETEIGAIKFGDKFFLSNAVPHAQYIEFGSPTTEAHYITRRVAQAIGAKFGRIK